MKNLNKNTKGELILEIQRLNNWIEDLNKEILNLRMKRLPIQSSNLYMEEILDGVQVGVILISRDEEIIYANKMAVSILQMTNAELLGKKSTDTLWRMANEQGEALTPNQQPSNITLKSGKPISEAIRILYAHNNDRKRWLSISTYPIFADRNTEVSGVITTFIDITDKIRSEEKLTFQMNFNETLIATANALIIGLDSDANITLFNEFCEKITGYSRKEVLGKNWFDLFIVDADKQKLRDVFKQVWKGDNMFWGNENKILCKNGGNKQIRWQNSRIKNEWGDTTTTIAIGLDITKESRALKAARKSEKEWEEIFQAIGHPTVILDPSYGIIAANEATQHMAGKKEPELIGKRCYEIFHGVHKPPQGCPMAKAYAQRTSYSAEIHLNNPVGDYLVSCTPICNEQGEVGKIIHIATDLTEFNKAKEELQELFIMSFDLVCVADLQTASFLKLNPAFEKALGYTQKELLEKSFLEFVHPDDVQKTIHVIENYLKMGKKVMNFKNRYRCNDGSYRWLEWLSHPVPEKNITYAVARDVTENEKVLQKLQESERKFHSLFNDAVNMIHIVDEKGCVSEVNKTELELMEYTKDEYLGKRMLDLVHPSYHKEIEETLNKVWKGEVKKDFETVMLTKSGNKLLVGLSASPNIISGVVKSLRIVMRDITEQARAKERLKLISEISTDLIYEWTVATDHLVWFGDVDKALGAKPGELAHTINAWISRIHPKDREQINRAVEIHRVETKPIHYEYRIKHEDGTYRYWLDKAAPVLDEEGKPYKWIGGCTDISETKMAELALRESEELFTAFMDYLPGSIFIKDEQGRAIYVNQEMDKIFGAKNWLGKDPYELFSKELADKFIRDDKMALKKGFFKIVEKLKGIDGKEHIFETRKFAIKYKDKNQILGGIAMDIDDKVKAETARKNYEKELKKHQKQLEKIVKERTQEIEKRKEQLERMNKLFVGREFRIKELRDKIKQLEGKLKKEDE